MQTRTLKSDFLLLLTSSIWGFAFVAQRAGMEHVGPFTFNAVRFALGSLALLPFVYYFHRGKEQESHKPLFYKNLFLGGSLAGLALFMGSSFQQIGIVYTTAGKAGFITGLYVILVPIMGLAWHQRAGTGTWLGAVLAVIGLYFLSVRQNLTISPGDLLVLVSAFFWAAHVHIIGWLATKMDSLKIALVQFITCSLLSFVGATFAETITIPTLQKAAFPILYAGLLSVGVAYTLQIVAQKDAPPAHAAIILSFESVFAVLGGWLLLGEILSLRGLLGCTLMLSGMLLSQLSNHTHKRTL
ncbi:MAG: DMT family transporter [Calditrichaeota bacterium]|nr:DMT family transporter [Calditrichota bacterium]